MSEEEIRLICYNADMIVCGYAFTQEENSVRIVGLNKPHHALVISRNDEVLETTMDDVEISIVMRYWKRNQKHMEDLYAEVF